MQQAASLTGFIDTSILLIDAAVYNNVFGSVVSDDGASNFWMSSEPFASGSAGAPSPPPSTNAGIRFFSGGASSGYPSSSTLLYNSVPMSSLTIGPDHSLYTAKPVTALTGNGAAAWGRIGAIGWLTPTNTFKLLLLNEVSPAASLPTTTAASTATFQTYSQNQNSGCQVVFQVNLDYTSRYSLH